MNDHLAIDEIEEGCLISQEAVPENEVDIQIGAAGFDTGKGEKLSNSQARVAWVLLRAYVHYANGLFATY